LATAWLFFGFFITIIFDTIVHQISDHRCGHDINNKTYVSGHGDLDRPFGNTEADDEGLNIVVAKDHSTIVNGDMGYDCNDANDLELKNKDKNKELLNTSCCSA